MMKLKSSEVMLTGKWESANGVMQADFICNRIENLITNILLKVCEDKRGWQTLYKDPIDNRYWMLTYPKSELHGGGPPQLENISNQLAKEKFKL